jgi:hypothetical protein
VGTDCGQGSALATMPLRKGYYRLDATSVDVHMCPDARENCSATFGRTECKSTSGCQGGTGSSCANNLTGVFCQLCNRSDLDAPVYYKSSTANAVARCVACGDTIVSTILVGVAIIVAAALAAFLGYMMWQRASPETIDQLEHINNTCSRKQAQDPVCLTRLQRRCRACTRSRCPRMYTAPLRSFRLASTSVWRVSPRHHSSASASRATRRASCSGPRRQSLSRSSLQAAWCSFRSLASRQ